MTNKNERQDICIVAMKKDIDFIKEHISKVPTKDEMALAIQNGITKALESCDEKYAAKQIEKIVNGIIWFVIIAVIGTGLAYIGIHGISSIK